MTNISSDKPLVITAGEPAGIGPDLCIRLAVESRSTPLVIIADPEQVRRRAELLSQTVDSSIYEPGKVFANGALDVALPPAARRVSAAHTLLDVVDRAPLRPWVEEEKIPWDEPAEGIPAFLVTVGTLTAVLEAWPLFARGRPGADPR